MVAIMRSEGSRLLGAVPLTRRQAGRRIGVSHETICCWISGKRVPRPEHRRALRTAFCIPEDAWPDEWALVRDIVVRLLAEKDRSLLAELARRLEAAGIYID
jgi:hypothetical protein